MFETRIVYFAAISGFFIKRRNSEVKRCKGNG